MAMVLTGIFPNRETAERARFDLESTGFKPTRRNAEDFGRADYYNNQMPQGATLISVEAGEREAEAWTIMQRAGGSRLDDVVEGDPMPTAEHGRVNGGIDPGPSERQALADKGDDLKR